MSLAPKVKPQAPAAAPAAAGADNLVLGNSDDQDLLLGARGILGQGRLKLRAPAKGSGTVSPAIGATGSGSSGAASAEASGVAAPSAPSAEAAQAIGRGIFGGNLRLGPAS